MTIFDSIATRSSADYRSFEVSVERVLRLSDNLVRVTFAGVDLFRFHAAGFDLRVKLIFPTETDGLSAFPIDDPDWYRAWRAMPDERRNPLRTYTVRTARPEICEIDVDFVLHGDTGPATRWARRAKPGAPLIIVGPAADTFVRGNGPIGGVEFDAGTAGTLLLAGDETAAPAICSILESLPADAVGRAFIEVAESTDIQRVKGPRGVSVTWLTREGRTDLRHGEQLCTAVRAWVSEMVTTAPSDAGSDRDGSGDDALWEIPARTIEDRDLYAWIAGESGCIKELRRFLVREAGVDRQDVAFMGYWREGRPEND